MNLVPAFENLLPTVVVSAVKFWRATEQASRARLMSPLWAAICINQHNLRAPLDFIQAFIEDEWCIGQSERNRGTLQIYVEKLTIYWYSIMTLLDMCAQDARLLVDLQNTWQHTNLHDSPQDIHSHFLFSEFTWQLHEIHWTQNRFCARGLDDLREFNLSGAEGNALILVYRTCQGR